MISEVWGRWLPQCVIKQQTASLNMELPYWAPPRSGICARHHTGFLRPFFMAFLTLSEKSTNKTGEKSGSTLHQPDAVQVRNSGKHREKLFFSFLAVVTHFKMPHYNVLARTLVCQNWTAAKSKLSRWGLSILEMSKTRALKSARKEHGTLSILSGLWLIQSQLMVHVLNFLRKKEIHTFLIS